MKEILYNPNILKYLMFFTLMIGCLLVLILITSIIWKLYSNFIYKHNSKLLEDIHKKYSNDVQNEIEKRVKKIIKGEN